MCFCFCFNIHTLVAIYAHMYTTKQQYGGPFGPDPYYIYGQKSAAQGLYGFSSMGH